MTSPNDSVILCETPIITKQNLQLRLVDCRERLRSCQRLKNNLIAAYYSPLAHLKRNIRPNDVTNAESSFEIAVTPPPKRRKLNTPKTRKKLDSSVVVLNETRPQPIVEISLSDSDSNNDVSPGPVTSKKKARLRKRMLTNSARSKRLKERNLKKQEAEKKKAKSLNRNEHENINDENHNDQIMGSCGSEDIEIVWVSQQQNGVKNRQTPNKGKFIAKPTLLSAPKSKKGKKKGNGKKKKSALHEKEMSLNSMSNNSVNSSKNESLQESKRLREIVIDGSNVAYGHIPGNGFSEKALEIVINYFEQRGHTVTAFVPQSMRMKSRELLEKLHKRGRVIFTPSRKIGTKRITPYDDRFILDYATKCNGIVITSDQYRDLWKEKPQWRDTIENRLLAPTFVGDYLMFPEDPLGRSGPKLEEFLRY